MASIDNIPSLHEGNRMGYVQNPILDKYYTGRSGMPADFFSSRALRELVNKV